MKNCFSEPIKWFCAVGMRGQAKKKGAQRASVGWCFFFNGRLNAWNGEKKKPHKRTTGRWAPLGKENCLIIPTLSKMCTNHWDPIKPHVDSAARIQNRIPQNFTSHTSGGTWFFVSRTGASVESYYKKNH